ncbi:MAG: 4-hydroxy-3-methylbut-2-enyl diphosphate reductase, partial [Actinomycetota bacterium]|nr:4-hydroxy-3-methylbut-2-enyl diphosphate reductase [Actinomycetota bacterium]
HEGHDEAVGTMAVAPDAVALIESDDDVDRLALPEDSPVALLAQTTLAMQDWAGVMERARQRFPELWMPGRSDLCFATTNRQTALRAIAGKADAVIVIGSQNSSNTVALEKTAASAGCGRVLRVNGADEVPDDISGVVGVTAGASAPEELVDSILAKLAPVSGVELVEVTEEDEYFPPPRELRTLLAERGLADALADDRSVSASQVLASLHEP